MSGTEENHTSQGLKTSRILILECARKLKVFDILDDRRGQKSSRIHGAVVPEHRELLDCAIVKNLLILDSRQGLASSRLRKPSVFEAFRNIRFLTFKPRRRIVLLIHSRMIDNNLPIQIVRHGGLREFT